MPGRCLLVFMLLVGFIGLCDWAIIGQAAGQKRGSDPPVDWRQERAALDEPFAKDLRTLIQWCQDNDLAQQIPPTASLLQTRDLNRQYIFPASEKKSPRPQEGPLGVWLEKVTDIRQRHAANIFALAKRAAAAKDDAVAFQLMHEVIHHDRDHAAVRRALGHRELDDAWQVNSDRIRVKNARSQQPTLGWAARTYITVNTPHFSIASNATEQQTRYLAEKLEDWHDVWRQVFFEYWSNASVARWIDGKGQFSEPRRRFRVAFFKDHASYVQGLARYVKGVEGSTGYYDPDLKWSFFPAGDDAQTQATWRHELTHQLFRESIRTQPQPFAQQHLWLDEGIAMYFESLTPVGSYYSLGGFDSGRLQFAKIEKFRESFYLPLGRLAALSKTQFQTQSDLPAIYSQSAGMTHMLMNLDHGRLQGRVIEFMGAIHRRRSRGRSFEKVMGISYAELDQAYFNYLNVQSDDVAKFLSVPGRRTELALMGADLQDDAFARIGRCVNLQWLDLSVNTITPTAVGHLSQCDRLQKLFLRRCKIEPAALERFADLKSLSEIDLSGSNVTDAGLAVLAKVKTLRLLDVSGTGVSVSACQRLKAANPNLEIVR